MLCSDLMKLDVEHCLDTSLVTEAAIAMRDRNVGFLPICDDRRVVVGTLTDRDIVVRVLAAGLEPDRACVADVMTHEVISCRPQDELAVAEDAMIRFQKSRIVCTDADRRIVGVISLSDIAKIDPHGHAGKIAAAVSMREAAALSRPPTASPGVLKCRDVMKIDVECVGKSHMVLTATRMMQRRNVGFLPVCNDEGAVLGAITDRDIVVRVVAARLAVDRTMVGKVFSPEIAACSPDDPLKAAEDLMAQTKKSRIVCTDSMRHPLGVVSLSDVARIEGVNTVTRVLRAVSTRTQPAWP